MIYNFVLWPKVSFNVNYIGLNIIWSDYSIGKTSTGETELGVDSGFTWYGAYNKSDTTSDPLQNSDVMTLYYSD